MVWSLTYGPINTLEGCIVIFRIKFWKWKVHNDVKDLQNLSDFNKGMLVRRSITCLAANKKLHQDHSLAPRNTIGDSTSKFHCSDLSPPPPPHKKKTKTLSRIFHLRLIIWRTKFPKVGFILSSFKMTIIFVLLNKRCLEVRQGWLGSCSVST